MASKTLDEAWAALEAAAPLGATVSLTRSGPPWDQGVVYRAELRMFRDEHYVMWTGEPAADPVEAIRQFVEAIPAHR